jgi:hypothetical protein
MKGRITFALIVLFTADAAVAQHYHSVPAAATATPYHTPMVVPDRDGVLWRVWVEGQQHVLVSRSADGGRAFGAPVRVTREPEPIDANGESRPKLGVGPGGELYVSYTRKGRQSYTGDVRFSRSLDGGRTFDPPRTINDDGLETGHRFDTLIVGPDGAVHIAWIDKRDQERAKAASRPYEGAAVYYTVSRDRGASFAPNRKVKDHVCECCRIAAVFDQAGDLVLAWRDIMPGSMRDHAFVRMTRDGQFLTPRRLTRDGWVIEACPHHGPALAAGRDGTLHAVWFTGESPQGPGAFYARFDREGAMRERPRRLGPPQPGVGHTAVHVDGDRVVIVWKEARGSSASLMAATSRDGGQTLSAPHELATASRSADHPTLVVTRRGLRVSWFSADTGHRLLPVEEAGSDPGGL